MQIFFFIWTGVAEQGSGKSAAYDFGMGKPLDNMAETQSCPKKLNDCSKAALLKAMEEKEGKGIICADEVSQFLTGMLKRSQSDASGKL